MPILGLGGQQQVRQERTPRAPLPVGLGQAGTLQPVGSGMQGLLGSTVGQHVCVQPALP